MKIITIEVIGTIPANTLIDAANNYANQLINEGKAIVTGGEKVVKTIKNKKHANNRNS